MAAPLFDIIEVRIDDVFVVGNRRPVDSGAVERLAQSIKSIGLNTPITVREGEVIDPDNGEPLMAYVLIAGRHRFEAFKRLGYEHIPAVIRDCDEIEAQLWEIAENLHRAELTALERDEQVAKWIELNQERIVTTCDSSKPGPKGAEREASKELGIDRMAVNRAVKVANLSEEAKEAAREVGLDDNRSALLEAARKPTIADQVAAIQERAQAKVKPAKLADEPLNDFEAKEKQVASLMSAWNKASPEAREEFLSRIDTPIMDRRFS